MADKNTLLARVVRSAANASQTTVVDPADKVIFNDMQRMGNLLQKAGIGYSSANNESGLFFSDYTTHDKFRLTIFRTKHHVLSDSFAKLWEELSSIPGAEKTDGYPYANIEFDLVKHPEAFWIIAEKIAPHAVEKLGKNLDEQAPRIMKEVNDLYLSRSERPRSEIASLEELFKKMNLGTQGISLARQKLPDALAYVVSGQEPGNRR